MVIAIVTAMEFLARHRAIGGIPLVCLHGVTCTSHVRRGQPTARGAGPGGEPEGRGWPADAARGPPDDVTRRTARPAAGCRPQGTGVTSRTRIVHGSDAKNAGTFIGMLPDSYVPVPEFRSTLTSLVGGMDSCRTTDFRNLRDRLTWVFSRGVPDARHNFTGAGEVFLLSFVTFKTCGTHVFPVCPF